MLPATNVERRRSDITTQGRITFSPNLGFVSVDPEVAKLVKNAVELFQSLGALVEVVDPGFEGPAGFRPFLLDSSIAKLLRDIPVERHALTFTPLWETPECH